MLGMNLPSNYQPQRPQSNNILVPGSQAHSIAFHAKGPDYEIKFFVGGLAFQTQGTYPIVIELFI